MKENGELEEWEVQLMNLYEKLEKTDYIALKLIEAQVTDPDTVDALKTEYADVLTNRKAWRAEINELQERYGLD